VTEEGIGGPFLQMAVFCDKVLTEADGVSSVIRVVDRWMVNGIAEIMPLTVISTNIVLMLKSGLFRGKATVTVSPESPSGQKMPPIILSVNFEGDNDRGITLAIPLGFPVQEEGVYWFSLEVNGQLFTRMPFRVLYQRILNLGVLPPLPRGPENQ
jgi:hypothetical protein